MLIQFAVSRQREFEADRVGAEILGRPLPLANALRRLDALAHQIPMQVAPAAAPLAQVNPLAATAAGSAGCSAPTRRPRSGWRGSRRWRRAAECSATTAPAVWLGFTALGRRAPGARPGGAQPALPRPVLQGGDELERRAHRLRRAVRPVHPVAGGQPAGAGVLHRLPDRALAQRRQSLRLHPHLPVLRGARRRRSRRCSSGASSARS